MDVAKTNLPAPSTKLDSFLDKLRKRGPMLRAEADGQLNSNTRPDPLQPPKTTLTMVGTCQDQWPKDFFAASVVRMSMACRK